MIQQEPKALGDFLIFTRAMLASGDAEPFYRLIAFLMQPYSVEQSLWFTVLFRAYVHTSSAWEAFQMQSVPGILPQAALRLPLYQDRRGLRGGRIATHLDSYLQLILPMQSQLAWITQGWGRNPLDNYELFWRMGHQVWGNGRWAVFHWASMLRTVHGLPLAAPDMRLRGASGPRLGLASLYRLPPDAPEALYQQASYALMARLQRAGIDLSWEALEKIVCNWYSMVLGRYYVGYDIDAIQEEIMLLLDTRLQQRFFQARLLYLAPAYLGELHGRSGVDHIRQKAYRREGVIHVR